MPQRDYIHQLVRDSLIKDGWEITDDPYVISYGERFLFVDLGASEGSDKGEIFGAQRRDQRIAIEIKDFRGKSVIKNLEQAIGQYTLYKLLLEQVDSERKIFLAVPDIVYDEFFSEPIGKLVIKQLPMNLLVVDTVNAEVKQWIQTDTGMR